MLVTPGDSSRLASIVGNRKNLHFTGTTGSSSLMECFKSPLKNVPLVPTSEKHSMMGAARVKDESRATVSAKGVLVILVT